MEELIILQVMLPQQVVQMVATHTQVPEEPIIAPPMTTEAMSHQLIIALQEAITITQAPEEDITPLIIIHQPVEQVIQLLHTTIHLQVAATPLQHILHPSSILHPV